MSNDSAFRLRFVAFLHLHSLGTYLDDNHPSHRRLHPSLPLSPSIPSTLSLSLPFPSSFSSTLLHQKRTQPAINPRSSLLQLLMRRTLPIIELDVLPARKGALDRDRVPF